MHKVDLWDVQRGIAGPQTGFASRSRSIFLPKIMVRQFTSAGEAPESPVPVCHPVMGLSSFLRPGLAPPPAKTRKVSWLASDKAMSKRMPGVLPLGSDTGASGCRNLLAGSTAI